MKRDAKSESRQLLHNCRNKLFNKARTNRSDGVIAYRVTVGRRVVNSHDVDRCECRQQVSPSTSIVDNTVELPCRKFLSLEFGANFQKEVPWFLEIPEFPYNTVFAKWKEVSVPKVSSIRPVVSTEYRLVTDWQTVRQTDRQTDTHTHDDSIYRDSIASRSKNLSCRLICSIVQLMTSRLGANGQMIRYWIKNKWVKRFPKISEN